MLITRRNALSLLAAGSTLPLIPQRGFAARANPFDFAKTWGYQLEEIGPPAQKKIAASIYDLVVTDNLIGEEDEGSLGVQRELSPEEVKAMQRKPDGSRRLIIDYLSIGESENYRYYWKAEWNKQRPPWMGKENKEWKGNYLVQYWQPAWQETIFGTPNSYVDRVLAEGYDGFYFDRVDAYYYFGDTKLMRDRMVDFIVRLSKYVRQRKPDAAIMVQNAEELLEYPEYVDAIDAVAKESLIYGVRGPDLLNTKDDITSSTGLLKKAQAAGKRIFTVEYLRKPETIADAVRRHKDLGFVLYMGPRGLGRLSGATPDGWTPPAQPVAAPKAAPAKQAGARVNSTKPQSR
jgi:cysteinyl-tRNA synthetase